MLRSRWIQSDDTGLDVQGARTGEPLGSPVGVSRRGGRRGLRLHLVAQPRRAAADAHGYRGYLQADAAPAFDDVFLRYPEIIEVGCWAHARRYFKEAPPTGRGGGRAGRG